MKSVTKIFLMVFIVCSAHVMCAQISDSSDASNSDNSNKVRHGGAPGSTASYTVHDGEVRPKENGKVKGNGGNNGNNSGNGNNSSGGETQTAKASSANMTGQATNSDSNSANNAAAIPTGGASTDMPVNNNCHFCWGWLGLLGLLGLGGLVKRGNKQV